MIATFDHWNIFIVKATDVIIYYHNMFIIQATAGLNFLTVIDFFYNLNLIKLWELKNVKILRLVARTSNSDLSSRTKCDRNYIFDNS